MIRVVWIVMLMVDVVRYWSMYESQGLISLLNPKRQLRCVHPSKQEQALFELGLMCDNRLYSTY